MSDKLKVSAAHNINKYMLEYDVYNWKHNYYITERFELCALEDINKYLFNHFHIFYKAIDHNTHIIYVSKQNKPIFIIQRVNTDTGLWKNINDKRLRLHKILKYTKLNL